MDKIIKSQVLKEKKVFDALGINYLNSGDKRIASFVARSLVNVKTGAITCGKTVTLPDVFHNSVKNMELFGNDIALSAYRFSLVNFLPINSFQHSFATHVVFNADEETMKVDQESGKVEHFKIPQVMDEVTADIFLTHEFIHGLKEVNYNEYVLITSLSDVIPLFYELVQIENDNRKKEFLNVRMFLLNIEKETYNNVSLHMKKSMTDKDLYKVIQSRSGEYLNSFYYALVLFNMYKDNPKMILELVRKVLNKEMSTLDLLVNLGLYHKNNDYIFNQELGKIRKVLK